MAPVRLGAYGFRLTGLERLRELLVMAAPSWPTARVEVEQGSIADVSESVDEARGTIVFRDAIALVQRAPEELTFRFAVSPALDALVHPYLAPAAGLLAHWRGWEALHAGAFVHRDGAWGIVADRGGGKSSTLARLSLQGVPVVTDDLLVVDGADVYAGPRAIDLRDEPARALGVGEQVGILGTRARWRLQLAPVPVAVPLRGWVFLEWGEQLAVDDVAPSARLERLGAQRMIRRRPVDPSLLLALAALPAVVLRRPPALSLLDDTVRVLLDSLPSRRGTE